MKEYRDTARRHKYAKLAWAKEDLLRAQNKELATLRRERDNSEAERAQHLKKIHELQEHAQEKERQIMELQEQHRVAQETIIYKDEQVREAQAWIARVQEMDALQSTTSHSLQVELRERTEQYNQLWLGCQRQKRFQNDDHVYKSFLDILNMYRKEQKGIKEVFQEVVALFDDQPDLLDEFTKFMPDASAAASAHHASLAQHQHDERSSAMAPHKQAQLDNKQRGGGRQDRINGSHPELDLNADKDDTTMMKAHKDQRKRSEKESRDRKSSDQDYKEPDLDANKDIRHSEKRKSSNKIDDFGVHSGVASHGDEDSLKSCTSKNLLSVRK